MFSFYFFLLKYGIYKSQIYIYTRLSLGPKVDKTWDYLTYVCIFSEVRENCGEKGQYRKTESK